MEIEVKIEPFEEGGVVREGLIAEGSYIWDAMKRLGVYVELNETEENADCIVKIKKGKGLLSRPTKIEREKLTEEQLKAGERLAKQTKIIKAGELIFMPIPPKTEETAKETAVQMQEDFEKLPFDQKFAALARMEAIALNETVNFVFNLPRNLGGYVVDFLATFGRQMDDADRDAKRPTEHKETSEENNSSENNSSEVKEKKETVVETKES